MKDIKRKVSRKRIKKQENEELGGFLMFDQSDDSALLLSLNLTSNAGHITFPLACDTMLKTGDGT
jgi:hypothetical protein